MTKIAFLGAGSTVFAKTILGDSMLKRALCESEIALYDIDAKRLKDSQTMVRYMNKNINKGRAKIKAYHGVKNRKAALRDADFVVNAIQIGGYEPSTVIDFEVPKKYGLRQTIGDTLGIGGIFRALRTIPVMMDIARDMEAVCPDAILINYSNPMAMLTGAVLRGSSIQTVGLCHSVQSCMPGLLKSLKLDKKYKIKDVKWSAAGINHMTWLLEVSYGGKDLYPEIKKIAGKMVRDARKKGAKKCWDMVRLEMMRHFGYYITESSEHSAEYTPYWIKSQYPELIEEFDIPLDEYPRRCVNQIAYWERQRKELTSTKLTHKASGEYAPGIMEGVVTNRPYKFHGNIMNTGLIPNLPAKACVEVPCIADRNGIGGIYVGELPEQLAALNRTNINPQLMAIEAAMTLKKDAVYQAAYLDPHTAAELPLDKIRKMCDALIKAHGSYLPRYK